MDLNEELVYIQRVYDAVPLDVFKHMLRFIPRKRVPRPPRYPAGLQRQLEALQRSPKQTAMGLYGLEDFVLTT